MANIFIGLLFLEGQLTGAVYAGFLEHALLGLLGDVPLTTRARMYIQRDGAPPHTRISRHATQY
jgi:hypothetical protein